MKIMIARIGILTPFDFGWMWLGARAEFPRRVRAGACGMGRRLDSPKGVSTSSPVVPPVLIGASNLLEQVFEERLNLRVFAATKHTEGDLAPLNRLGWIFHDLFELLIRALILILAESFEQARLQIVIVLRVVEREQERERVLLAAVRDGAYRLSPQFEVAGAARDFGER